MKFDEEDFYQELREQGVSHNEAVKEIAERLAWNEQLNNL